MTTELLERMRKGGAGVLFGEPVTVPVPDLTTNPAECGYNAKFDPQGRLVQFGGPGGFMAQAELIRGDLQGLIGTGFLALSRPASKVARIQRRGTWHVTVPKSSRYSPRTGSGIVQKDDVYVTKGDNRRILEIKGPEVAVLRFDRPIPRPLALALEMIFEGKSFPRKLIRRREETSNEEDG